tara:strand:+ start:14205 stop:14564 length:360 start_codon:yes stop_codon:yes gene_type:complete
MADARIQVGPSLTQSGSGQLVPVHLIDSSGAGKTGITSPTLSLSKSGATPVTPSDGAWTQVGAGIYTIRLDETDTNFLGWITITVTHGSAEDATVLCEISINANEKRSSYIRQRATYRS